MATGGPSQPGTAAYLLTSYAGTQCVRRGRNGLGCVPGGPAFLCSPVPLPAWRRSSSAGCLHRDLSGSPCPSAHELGPVGSLFPWGLAFLCLPPVAPGAPSGPELFELLSCLRPCGHALGQRAFEVCGRASRSCLPARASPVLCRAPVVVPAGLAVRGCCCALRPSASGGPRCSARGLFLGLCGVPWACLCCCRAFAAGLSFAACSAGGAAWPPSRPLIVLDGLGADWLVWLAARSGFGCCRWALCCSFLPLVGCPGLAAWCAFSVPLWRFPFWGWRRGKGRHAASLVNIFYKRLHIRALPLQAPSQHTQTSRARLPTAATQAGAIDPNRPHHLMACQPQVAMPRPRPKACGGSPGRGAGRGDRHARGCARQSRAVIDVRVGSPTLDTGYQWT